MDLNFLQQGICIQKKRNEEKQTSRGILVHFELSAGCNKSASLIPQNSKHFNSSSIALWPIPKSCLWDKSMCKSMCWPLFVKNPEPLWSTFTYNVQAYDIDTWFKSVDDNDTLSWLTLMNLYKYFHQSPLINPLCWNHVYLWWIYSYLWRLYTIRLHNQ